MKRAFSVSLVVFLALLGFTLAAGAPIGAAAASARGSSPDTAIALNGTKQGSLPSGATLWYKFSGDGSSPAGVVMDYVPTNLANDSNVYFNVDWTLQDGQAGADWPGYWRVGQGTQSGLPAGQRYWVSQTTQLTTYYVEVVNTSGQTIGYALGLLGATFPPPYLNPPLPGSAPAAAPATPLPANVPTGPTVTPTVVPTATSGPRTLNTATDSSGLILQPQVQVEGPFSTVFVNVTTNSPNAMDVTRIRVLPPNGAVIDGTMPSLSAENNGVVWFSNFVVGQTTPLTGYSVRFWGSANGTVVEADYANATTNGALIVTLHNAPQPAPPGAVAPQAVPSIVPPGGGT